jgi:hypothetical protein
MHKMVVQKAERHAEDITYPLEQPGVDGADRAETDEQDVDGVLDRGYGSNRDSHDAIISEM